MQQLSMFDFELNDNGFNDLYNKLKKYEIDDIFISNHKGKCNTFIDINDDLVKNSNYDNYILELFEELKKYFKPVSDARDNEYWNKETAVMSLSTWSNGSKFIDIYLPAKGNKNTSVGPYFCLSMIPKIYFTKE